MSQANPNTEELQAVRSADYLLSLIIQNQPGFIPPAHLAQSGTPASAALANYIKTFRAGLIEMYKTTPSA